MLFRVLGPVDVVRATGEQVGIQQPKQRAVLSALLLHANQWLAADRLIDMVWGENPPRSAAGSLKTYIWKLRGLLPDRSDGRITSGAGTYLIGVARDELDAYLFEDLVLAGRRALRAGQLDRAAATLSSAANLWRGEPFGDLEMIATESTLVRLRDQRLAAQEDLAIARLALGEHSTLVPDLRTLIASQPWEERPRALLMLALYRAGRQAEALQVFEATREVLDRELGLRPGAELVRLHQDILSQGAHLDEADPLQALIAAAPLTGDTVSDVPNLSEPNPADPPVVPFQLPADIASFTGRHHDLADLDDILLGGDSTTPGARKTMAIGVIAGAPGVGKTALALHWAHGVRRLFPDGTLYVSMRGYSAGSPMQPTDALAELLRSLGVSPDRVPVNVAEQTSLYRSLLNGKRVLVVLDDVRSAGQVRPLLPGQPTCAALITSRDRLPGLFALDDATCVSLDVLPEAESHSLLVALLGADRVQTEPAATRALAELCGRLPLALRIAAANLAGQPHVSIAEFVSSLAHGNRLSALAVPGDEDAALKPAFDLSYTALPSHARVLFRRLGLLPGPKWTNLVAATVLEVPADDAARLLALLRTVHLVEQHAPDEYRFHDLLREYARDRAMSEELAADRAAVLGRVLEFYRQAAGAAASFVAPGVDQLSGPPVAPDTPRLAISDADQAIAWLEHELPNLTALIRYAADHQDLFRYAWLLADAQRGYFWVRRYGSDWLLNAQAGLRAAVRADDRIGQAAMHRMIGLIQWSLGESHDAVAQHNEALALFRSTGDGYGEASTLTNLGIAFWEMGKLQAAREHHEQALAIFQDLDHDYGIAAARTNIGRVYQQLGRLDEAMTEHEQARLVFSRLGNQYGAAAALNGLGAVNLEIGHLDEAIATHRQVLDMGDQAGSYERTIALTALANAYRQKGLIAEAAMHAEHACSLAMEAELRVPEGFAQICLAEIHLDKRRYDLCETHAQRAATLLRSTRSLPGQAHALRLLGEARLRTHGSDLATSTWLNALSLCSSTDEAEARKLVSLLNENGIAVTSPV